jgi:hypothetical protein
MTYQLLPSAECEEINRALIALLSARCPVNPGDAYFVGDWDELWLELAEGGWTALADRSSVTNPIEHEFSLLDLASVAEVWGTYLVPLPFMPTLVARRALADPPDPQTPLSYVLHERGVALVCHGRRASLLLAGSGLRSREEFPPSLSVDSWAESLPIEVLSIPVPEAGPTAQREAAIMAAAEAVGAAAEIMRRSVEYAKIRKQFGQPIGSFQAVKHRLATMHCNVEFARSAVVWACSEADRAGDATRTAIDRCLRVAEDAIQVHGGIGYTWEAAPHRFYRHVMSLRRLIVASC